MATIPRDFPTRARYARERAGFTSEQAAADAIGCGRTTVIRWEKDAKSISGNYLHQAALAYKVRPDWLTLRSDDDGFPWDGRDRPHLRVVENSPAPSAVQPPATVPGYLRLGIVGEGGMGLAVENQDFPEVIREMQFSERQLRSILGFLPKPGRIALMTGRGHSMEPLISHGDVVMVDTAVTYYDEAGPYVINLGDGQQIKTLQNRGDGIYVVSLNEKVGGPAFRAPEDMIIGGKVYVVQKFVMAH